MSEVREALSGKKKILDLTGSGFLKHKGLKRDKANFVTMLIRVRAELGTLRNITMDDTVAEEIELMEMFLGETIDYMYTLEENERRMGA